MDSRRGAFDGQPESSPYARFTIAHNGVIADSVQTALARCSRRASAGRTLGAAGLRGALLPPVALRHDTALGGEHEHRHRNVVEHFDQPARRKRGQHAAALPAHDHLRADAEQALGSCA